LNIDTRVIHQCPFTGLTFETKEELGEHILALLDSNYYDPSILPVDPDTPSFEGSFWEMYDEAFNLLVERQYKYGPDNIENQGMYGVFTRIRDDKMSRIAGSFVIDGMEDGRPIVSVKDTVADETFEDALLDIANYAIIMLALYRNLWAFPLEEDLEA
jgi:hypothetical protein